MNTPSPCDRCYWLLTSLVVDLERDMMQKDDPTAEVWCGLDLLRKLGQKDCPNYKSIEHNDDVRKGKEAADE